MSNNGLRSRRTTGIIIVGALVLVLALGWYLLSHRSKPTPAPAPLRVRTMTVAPRAVPDIVETAGTIISRQTVDVTPQTGGILTAVLIGDGAMVHRGQLLFTIDPRPLRASLAQAQATLVHDQALARDAADTARRYAPLAAKGAIDAKSLVTATDTTQSLNGTVAADRAAIRAAQLSLAYTRIRAPIDGKAGYVAVKPGNVVAAGSTTALVTINTVSPIEMNFALPLAQVEAIRKAGGTGGGLAVLAIDAATRATIGTGRLYFLDNAYDTSSGTLTLRARFANPGGALTPGRFVTARVVLSNGDGSLWVPESALQQGQDGPYVYVLVGGHAQVRQLAVARLVDGVAVISKGLNRGDTVILTVPNELRSGDAVQSTNQRLPAATPTPAAAT